MLPSEIQTVALAQVLAHLATVPALATVPVFLETGSVSNDNDRAVQDALTNGQGVAVSIQIPQNATIPEGRQSSAGIAEHYWLPITLCENTDLNRSENGTELTTIEIITEIKKSLLTSTAGAPNQLSKKFSLRSPSSVFLSKEDGFEEHLINFNAHTVVPL